MNRRTVMKLGAGAALVPTFALGQAETKIEFGEMRKLHDLKEPITCMVVHRDTVLVGTELGNVYKIMVPQ